MHAGRSESTLAERERQTEAPVMRLLHRASTARSRAPSWSATSPESSASRSTSPMRSTASTPRVSSTSRASWCFHRSRREGWTS